MAEPTKSLFQRLMERRAAITAGDPTGAATGPNTAEVRKETAPPRSNASAAERARARRKKIEESIRNGTFGK